MQPLTFDAVSALTPFYASVDQVKMNGGVNLRRISDITIAGQIYTASKAVDMMNWNAPLLTSQDTNRYYSFINARNLWVMNKAGQDLMLSLGNLIGSSSHVLANFSVANTKGNPNEGNSGKLTEFAANLKLYDPTIRSGGLIEPGGHVRPKMAAKGVMDWTEKSPGRTWARNSVGANTESADYGSATGGRGKPVGYFAHSIYSPSLCNYRIGTFSSGYNIWARGWAF